MRRVVFLFGEAEKGEFCTPLVYKSLPQLAEELGNPPQDSKGILYAVQTLMYDRELIFFRVKEEGFSREDYMRGLNLLKNKDFFSPLSAICMPGVGDGEIIHAMSPLCSLYQSFLIVDEKDLYDYLTSHHLK
jgi:hypothetical protein